VLHVALEVDLCMKLILWCLDGCLMIEDEVSISHEHARIPRLTALESFQKLLETHNFMGYYLRTK
jgi:hypothetical protein